MARTTGQIQQIPHGDEMVASYVPFPLPPADPPLDPAAYAVELDAARLALARLDLAGEMVPSLDWFVYAFVRKEAVLSSRIEGTQATLEDLLRFEATESTRDASPDVREVCHYLDALAYAREQIADPRGLPISMTLLGEAHRRLLAGARGADRLPGEIRRVQNWIGGTRPGNAVFVPPPPHRLPGLLEEFERFLQAESDLPPLVRAGLLHVQFETIHPFLDGNGRIGRLLVGLLLEEWGLLRKPLLYLSLFLMQHRREYYRLLDAVRHEGAWEEWLRFFLAGVARTAEDATTMARDLSAQVERDRAALLAREGIAVAAIRLFEMLPRFPVLTVGKAVEELGVTRPTAGAAVAALEDAGLLREITGRKRDRAFGYEPYLSRLQVEGDEAGAPGA